MLNNNVSINERGYWYNSCKKHYFIWKRSSHRIMGGFLSLIWASAN